MSAETVRATLWGAGIGGGLFALVGFYLNVSSGMGLFANPGPLGVFTLIGATAGGLVGPLLRRGLADSRRTPDAEEPSGPSSGDRGD